MAAKRKTKTGAAQHEQDMDTPRCVVSGLYGQVRQGSACDGSGRALPVCFGQMMPFSLPTRSIGVSSSNEARR